MQIALIGKALRLVPIHIAKISLYNFSVARVARLHRVRAVDLAVFAGGLEVAAGVAAVHEALGGGGGGQEGEEVEGLHCWKEIVVLIGLIESKIDAVRSSVNDCRRCAWDRMLLLESEVLGKRKGIETYMSPTAIHLRLQTKQEFGQHVMGTS